MATKVSGTLTSNNKIEMMVINVHIPSSSTKKKQVTEQIATFARNYKLKHPGHTKMSVRVGRTLSNTVDYNYGVRQGCPASPILFDFYINDLLDNIATSFEIDVKESHFYTFPTVYKAEIQFKKRRRRTDSERRALPTNSVNDTNQIR
ncbi:hypothetical protein BB561_003190 [Smittium simulii]|uniref:Reverse transcriptase domain-containing protein n=1 Tax=Smittium simulii TaxID=133385 RepID=A0A2T9YMJ1_9FUNG|nr:hypothetical protein BB561_003190 [Smittium simulii]